MDGYREVLVMTREQIFDEVKKLLVDRLGVDEDKITEETSFTEDLGADSLDIIELVMELEDAFDKEISDDDAQQLTTVGSVINYIEEQQ